MEHFEEYMTDPVASHGVQLDEGPEFAEHETEEHDSLQEPLYTDDPVRVYLREMGSVKLLTRQGEIDLARRMERGRIRTQKALSRAPVVWDSALAMYESVRKGTLRLED